MELHGGTVHADSPRGTGATFTVSCRLLKIGSRGAGEQRKEILHLCPLPPLSPHPQPWGCNLSPLLLTGLRVLVVDDEADTRELLTSA